MAAAVATGCGPASDSGPASCVAEPFPGDASTPPARAILTLTVGAEDASRTRVAIAWTDGAHVPLIGGAQGGFMIRPAIDVVAAAPLPEDGAHASCLAVRMIAAAPASAPPLSIDTLAPRVAGTSSTYHVAPLFGLLSNNGGVGGMSVPLTFDVHSPAGDGHAQVTVVPDATL